MLTANFVRDKALYCRDEGLAYLAIHNHGGRDSVGFSGDDLRSHERGYPALRDITRGQIVGGLVFAENAVAGDLWLKNGQRAALKSARIIAHNILDISHRPLAQTEKADPSYDRQARLFGDRGQALLINQRVGIIGLGGVGSLVCEYLSRLGVGALVLVDPDRLHPTNIPRVVGSTSLDALVALRASFLPNWLQNCAARFSRYKVDIAAREARKANTKIQVERFGRSVVDEDVGKALTTCDYLFLAADSMQARHVFNSLVHQYLIPGVQLGAKIPVNKETGEVGRVFSVVRPVLPGKGCLWCNGFVSPAGLQNEALTEEERIAQRYVDEPNVIAPSVITLNAVTAAHAVNDYLFRVTGLRDPGASDDYMYFEPKSALARTDIPRVDGTCWECSNDSKSRLARGDSRHLPTRPVRSRALG
jgi:hypothetical protein